jgi:hypothetical protein
VPEPRTMSRRTKWLIGILFAILVLVATVAPLTLMLVPNPMPVRVTDLGSQPSGAYVTTGNTIYHVFPRAEPLEAFPPDAPSVGVSPVVSIKAVHLDDPSKYSLYAFGGKPVDATRTNATPNILELRPSQPLRPGRYVAAIARDDLFGGTDYVYFSVAANVTAP